MNFRIGQPVVCVDDSIPEVDRVYSRRLKRSFHLIGDLSGLKRGAVYTVRGIDVDWADETPVLFLEEIIRQRGPDEEQETGFAQRRFRPVQERKQSTEAGMSILLKLLRGERVEA